METLAFKPAVMSVGKVHREINMSTQGLEAGVVEPSDRTHVAGHRPDRQILIAASDGLSDHPLDKKSANALAAETVGDHNRFDFAAGPLVQQTGQTDNPTIEISHPGRHSFSGCEIVVERSPRIVASNRGILIDPSMMLRQFDPQQPARRIVSRRVVTDNNVGCRYRASELAVLHDYRLPHLEKRLQLPGATLVPCKGAAPS